MSDRPASEPVDESGGASVSGFAPRVGSPRVEAGRRVARLLLATIYIGFGGLHLAASSRFLPIMPPWVPYPQTVIVATGACEILGGVGLLGPPPLRRFAGVMLALYAVCVFPANLYHALSGVRVPGLPSSWWYHGPRLAFQPVFVWWALFAGGVTAWPWRRARR